MILKQSYGRLGVALHPQQISELALNGVFDRSMKGLILREAINVETVKFHCIIKVSDGEQKLGLIEVGGENTQLIEIAEVFACGRAKLSSSANNRIGFMEMNEGNYPAIA